MTSFLTWVLFLTTFLMSEIRLNFGRALYNRRVCRPQMMHDDLPVILSKFKVWPGYYVSCDEFVTFIGVGPTPKYDTTSPAQVTSDECPVTHPKHFAEVPNVDKKTRTSVTCAYLTSKSSFISTYTLHRTKLYTKLYWSAAFIALVLLRRLKHADNAGQTATELFNIDVSGLNRIFPRYGGLYCSYQRRQVLQEHDPAPVPPPSHHPCTREQQQIRHVVRFRILS
ncbi:uncharacterized protein HD556DRAFT_1307364 [Suillus plorans]|uniref:Uncharacterized protein n=1 Tax=Suillus plorans TaxID=116603 RepID=A0A9P7DJJ6_9AGAM|nr:uncharacterized protein HD556DRAFT_1307364 [Suillus plorans]KAG1795678.1 hypothetical protein HD556DRAFT_1307364 [Suillus plorans]